jgi:1-deoxy-D-xylulose-5-phosphate reductoisomerase
MSAAMTTTRQISILGATGSIGASALDVIARHPDRFTVAALAGNRRWEPLLELIRRFRPPFAALLDASAARELAGAARREGLATRVLAGPDGLCEVAALPEADTVVAAIVGAAASPRPWPQRERASAPAREQGNASCWRADYSSPPCATAARCCCRSTASTMAIFQCLPPSSASGREPAGVRRILLTASGGPFRATPLAELERVTPEQACAHPRWRMGRKISVDSATMMNKGLEVIEAHWLFGCACEQIEVVIHPESVVHSLVEYLDGSVLAQLGNPDMRTPIAQALAWPERVSAGVTPLDLAAIGALNFAAPDPLRFPCLDLAYGALRAGGSAPATLNAANEIAVAAFLDGRAGFLDIAGVCAETLSRLPARRVDSLDDALAADREARTLAAQVLERQALSA